ncbi:unnamed protein product [Spirodela intermedia]|uniref:PROP1-like PPR domain-containing protein n=1 Tax=Spirodela intermedia TaxID=51605 RepID=A0A7I8KR42_SPIIN|nr:unnamed protein product [Spirodela intermedia]
MSSKSAAASAAAKKFFFYHGHRRPSQNRPVVRGGLFTNRIAAAIPPPHRRLPTAAVDFRDWDPDHRPSLPGDRRRCPTGLPSSSSAAAQSLSPIARYICDSLRRHGGWCAAVLSDLRKLRRVSPELVAEVLKLQLDPAVSSRFFHWAGKQKGYRHSFAAYNALAHALSRSGRHRAADQVPELMAAQGKPPTEKQFEILIRFHAAAGRGLHIHQLFDKMRRKFKLRPRVFVYNRIMEALVRTGHLELALSVHRSFAEDGLREEAVTFMVLAKGLCKVGRVEEALRLVGRMKAELCSPDVFAYTAMLKLLAAGGHVDGCLKLWAAMAEEQDKVEPDAMAYTVMVRALCAAGRGRKGMELFREMKGKGMMVDRAVYAALVAALVAGGEVAAACELLKEMIGDGYRVDLGIYSSLISGMCTAGRADKALKLLRIAVVEEGLSPGPAAVTPLLGFHAAAGEAEKAVAVVDELAAAGLPVATLLESFFLDFAGGGGDGDRPLRALEVFGRLQEKNEEKSRSFCSSAAMYNALISGLRLSKQPEKAISLFRGMADAAVEGDCETYSGVIPCFVDIGDMPSACSCYNRMKELSWVPRVEAYRALVRGLFHSGEIAAAVGVVRDCLGSVATGGPREFKYAVAALQACRRGAGKVVAVVEEMAEEGVQPEEAVCAAVIDGFCRHGGGAAAEGAAEVWGVMRERGLITAAEEVVYSEMVEEHLKRTAAGLVLSGLKFFGLEAKMKLTRELAYRH